ncbi:MAG TPA: NAD(P)/FAD-dependent oxidoreductase [Polyangiales bacterium]|nr:NAD(P)/FAD-dependent oxidoreductase [Polyangiales bacterium]
MSAAPDYDVLVIGAGPGGIAAAMRVRWVKRYSVVPCHVAIIDPCTPGGLTQMGTCIMTSPSWIYTDETIKPYLIDDLSRFDVPHLRTRVTSIERQGDVFRVHCSDGTVPSARCVIVCCGMKMLVREPELWNKGVTATSMGIEWAAGKVRNWVQDAKHRRVVFVGSDKLSNLIPLARKCRAAHVDLRFVLEPIVGAPAQPPAAESDTLFGTVVEMTGQDGLRSITVQHAETGQTTVIEDIDLLVVDFLSYEVRPARNFACAGAAIDEAGFIVVDRKQHTDVPGLFAAGDVTGMPACAGTAVGEGIVAGFEAYRYVYREKFAAEPPLFAYYGRDALLEENFDELPSVPDTLGPRLLGSSEHVLSRAIERSSADERETITRTIQVVADAGGFGRNLPQIAGAAELTENQVAFAVRRLLEMKLITLSEVVT